MDYFPLLTGGDEFRLLKIYARKEEDEEVIRCQLFHASRNCETPSYQALSYCWGDPTDKAQIIVDGNNIEVSKNLQAALIHIREGRTDVTLWVDALCINQSDPEEKSEQVRHMKSIYANARSTIAWLGPNEDGSSEAIAEINRVGEHICRKGILEHMLEVQISAHPNSVKIVREGLATLFEESLQDLPHTIRFLTALHKFLSRSYWHRIWIVQEFVVSSEVLLQCGNARISSALVFQAGLYYRVALVIYLMQELLRRHDNAILQQRQDVADFTITQMLEIQATDPKSLTYNMIGMRNGYHDFPPDNRASLTSLIHHLAKVHVTGAYPSSSQATDARDRIFAFLGMSSDSEALEIIPNYEESNSCEVTFTQAATAIISLGAIDLLSFTQHRKRIEGLPSWVPDWRRPIMRPSGQRPWDTTFQACGKRKFQKSARVSRSTCEIQIQGFVVDSIKRTMTPWAPHEHFGYRGTQDGIFTYLLEVEELCKESNLVQSPDGTNIYTSSADRDTACSYVPIAGQEQLGNLFCRATSKSERGHASLFLRSQERGNSLKTPWTVDERSYITMMEWQRYRRPFISEKGYVGLVPDLSKKGDVLVVFLGGKFPYVLRENADKTHEFVGEAYVHGIIYGEFMDSEKDMKVEEFVLR